MEGQMAGDGGRAVGRSNWEWLGLLDSTQAPPDINECIQQKERSVWDRGSMGKGHLCWLEGKL